MSYKILEHTADLLIQAENESFERTLEDMAKGMFENMGKAEEKESFELSKSAPDKESLVVGILSDIIGECEARTFTPARMKVLEYKENSVKVQVFGKKKIPENIIKAVTYHMLEVKKNEKWKIKVLFDI